MKTRKPFDLRKGLFAWNVALAVFSAFGFLRVFSELSDVLSGQNGFHRSICVRDMLNVSTGFWNLALSIFGSSGSFAVQIEPIIRYSSSFNLLVHTFMYIYFALSAIDYKPSRQSAMCLTTLQILQFVIVLGTYGYAIGVKC
ncbi:putative fatty acid elongation protein 3 [Folsomia candida]|uniref:Elongation of very long chain fatty acids protein n=1 Tax=Folsomia candida TaxID=158441 RepID=A0A226DRE0_FOLCA|nr:putative fatty acid elongation protein 3 [Folsomia candida]